jgi:predicted transcriptional regulator of viral defense system/very-short-patch-repair endonuclease
MLDDCGSMVDIRPKITTHPADAAIAALAADQHGVVSGRQLAAAGVTPSMLKTRISRGLLVRLHRGVYAVGHRQLRREGHWLAAVLAVGPGAALSHRAAAALHGIGASGVAVDVSTPADRRGARGIRVHGRRRLERLDVELVEGISVTTVARTLVDLAGTVARDRLAKALNEAEVGRVLDVWATDAALERVRHRRGNGHAVLRAALAEMAEHGPALTRSELEVRFLALAKDHGLPRPRTNAFVGGMEVDALWPEPRVVAELDGYAHHRSKPAFQRDRTKSNALIARGYRVLRYTYDDVVNRPAAVAAELRLLVAS